MAITDPSLRIARVLWKPASTCTYCSSCQALWKTLFPHPAIPDCANDGNAIAPHASARSRNARLASLDEDRAGSRTLLFEGTLVRRRRSLVLDSGSTDSICVS